MSRGLLIFGILAATGVASARPQRHQADNMPRGFQWPPSRVMIEAGVRCEAKLDELGIAWKSAKREGHVVDAITLVDGTVGGIEYVPVYDRQLPAMDCQLALALATFAPKLYELGVRQVRVGSIYRFTKVRVGGKTKDMLSRHALGLAMDVVSFVDDAGREAVVGRDYKAGDQLLISIEHAIDDTGAFRTVLTPANDPISHADHFHIEANPDYTDDRPST
ncbi:MAG TPA: extensin family protein [Kofleriaceae bacterium]|nr:extensin family protein [Kofleriaceae bacterium]